MKKIAFATATAFFASVVAAAAMPGDPKPMRTTDFGLIQVEAKKMMKGAHPMAGKDMKGTTVKGDKEMKGMQGMKSKDAKGM